jgi:hypothetical protein
MQRFRSIRLLSFNLLVCALITIHCFGQENKNSLSVIAGGGNYEYIHSGIHISFDDFFIEAAVGIKPWNFNKELYVMEYISMGKIFYHPSPLLNAGLQMKLVHWNYFDDYTRISVLGAAPEIKISHEINSRLQATLNGGVIFNNALNYELKTYERVGWFNRFDPSFSIQLAYRL